MSPIMRRNRRSGNSNVAGSLFLVAVVVLALVVGTLPSIRPASAFLHQTHLPKTHVSSILSRSDARAAQRRWILFSTSDTGSSKQRSSSHPVRPKQSNKSDSKRNNNNSSQRKGPSRRPNNNNNNNNKNNNYKTKNHDPLWVQKNLNKRLVTAESANELFQSLQESSGALTKAGGGGILNTINFSTAIHRLARHSLKPKARPLILADPRLALLLAGIAEAMVNDPKLTFTSREISNIGWGLAKLRIAPPSSAMPLSHDSESSPLSDVATQIRQEIINASKLKVPGENLKPIWIPLLSKLAGLILDEIRHRVGNLKDYQQQELSNLLWAWATTDRADPAVFDIFIHQMIRNAESVELNPQEWSNGVWAFATARVYNGHEDLLDFLSELTEDESFVSKYKPQEISNTIWGAATLLSNLEGEVPPDIAQAVLRIIRAFVPSILEKIDEFKTQELANTLWGLATVGYGLNLSPEAVANNYLVLPSNTLDEDKYTKNQVVDAIIGAAQNRVYQFKSQELNNMAWALARLVDDRSPQIEAMLNAIGKELCNTRRRVTGQDIGTTIWSFATLEYFDEDLYRGLVSRITPEVALSCKPQELSNTLWAVATAEIDVGPEKDSFDTTFLSQDLRPKPRDPITFCFGIAALQLLQRPDSFKPQEIKDTLWSFSRVCYRHPELFRKMAEYLVGNEDDGVESARGLSEFSPQGLGNLAWAFARQAQLAEETTQRHKSITFSNGRLAVKQASYMDIGENLLHRFFREIAETDLNVHNGLSDLKPQDVSNTAWTFGLLGVCHDEFLEACKTQLQTRIKLYLSGQGNFSTFFKGQEISNLMWALASLNYSAHDMVNQVGLYLIKICEDKDGKVTDESVANMFKRQELANIAWSCAVNDVYPADLMKFLYTGLLGDQTNPARHSQVYNDGGLQDQAIMTLLYVQAAMELKGSTNGLTLPPDFPDGWQQESTKRTSSGDVVSPTFELNLSTSKIQRSVSAAFHRIGFEHVEEHVIAMESLASEYGVGIAPKSVEVLSIDLANLPERIAIEVDGPSHYFNCIDIEGTPDEIGFIKSMNGKLEYQFGWKGKTQRMNGTTALKDRLLKSLGWRVIHLPFWEWYALQGEEAEDAYCRNLLAGG